jgi:hypothetical protein
MEIISNSKKNVFDHNATLVSIGFLHLTKNIWYPIYLTMRHLAIYQKKGILKCHA